jgi:hypothetical protein
MVVCIEPSWTLGALVTVTVPPELGVQFSRSLLSSSEIVTVVRPTNA